LEELGYKISNWTESEVKIKTKATVDNCIMTTILKRTAERREEKDGFLNMNKEDIKCLKSALDFGMGRCNVKTA
jgi:hypothetical protein